MKELSETNPSFVDFEQLRECVSTVLTNLELAKNLGVPTRLEVLWVDLITYRVAQKHLPEHLQTVFIEETAVTVWSTMRALSILIKGEELK